ncbi:hypothetical protein EIP91_001792 [Steccherinum ochraceum]|uniref:RING-type E3 ubiquitin transferase n=1 Tax=Steccherinum ochraceum TaxID=92696 RepID=A0A4R0RTM9_9APHY|nr:hypothetical protein EIP91_001792 [Steccherinum ochraceum]
MDISRLLTPLRNFFYQPISPRMTILLFRFMIPTTLLAVYLLVLPLAHGHPAAWLRRISLIRPPGGGPGGGEETGNWLWGWAWASDGTVSVVDRSPAITYPARPASFGMYLSEPMLGHVIPLSSFTAPCPSSNVSSTFGFSWARYPFEADSVLGCPDLCISGEHQPDNTEKWVALVQRGGCPFVEKARMAQRLGARAIVVGGDKANPDALLNMYSEGDSSDVEIAATYIKYWDYVALSNMIAASNTSHNGIRTLSLLLTTEYSAWEWYSPILTFIIILLLPTLLTFITLLIHRVRAARAAERDRAPEEVVHRLPWRVWTGTGWEKHASSAPPPEAAEHGDADPDRDLERGEASGLEPRLERAEEEEEPEWVDKQEECAICLEVFVKGDRVRELPCGHIFHMDEVDEWLIQRKKLCPVCKADVTQPRSHAHLHHDDPSTHEEYPDIDASASTSPFVSSRTPSSLASPPTERTPLLAPRPAS